MASSLSTPPLFYPFVKGGGSHPGQWRQRVQPSVSGASLQSIVNRGQDLWQHSAGLCCFKVSLMICCDAVEDDSDRICWESVQMLQVEAWDQDCSPQYSQICNYEIVTAGTPFAIDRNGNCVCVCGCVKNCVFWVWFGRSRDRTAIVIADMMGGEVMSERRFNKDMQTYYPTLPQGLIHLHLIYLAD